MAYPRDICPGVGLPPKGPIRDVGKPRPHGKCPCCRRWYALKVGPRGDGWKLRHHKGLPVANDGGCPYRCPPDCDFDCYVPVGAR